jgi:hypothetical protein
MTPTTRILTKTGLAGGWIFLSNQHPTVAYLLTGLAALIVIAIVTIVLVAALSRHRALTAFRVLDVLLTSVHRVPSVKNPTGSR